jgi:hypothetical protein
MKGIIMSAESVRAILASRKTVTRRVVPERILDKYYDYDDWCNSVMPRDIPCTRDYEKDYFMWVAPYQPGQICYVKEAWRLVDFEYIDGRWSASVKYKDGTVWNRLFWGEEGADQRLGWRSPLYMPRAAARIWAEVTDVRCERLQSITEEDAIAEGAIFTDFGPYQPTWNASIDGGKTYYSAKEQRANGWHFSNVTGPDECHASARSAYAALWNSLHAKPKPVYGIVDDKKRVVSYISYPWEDIQEMRTYRGKPWQVCGNPFVYAVSFKRIEGVG